MPDSTIPPPLAEAWSLEDLIDADGQIISSPASEDDA